MGLFLYSSPIKLGLNTCFCLGNVYLTTTRIRVIRGKSVSLSPLFSPTTYTNIQIILYNLITWSMLTKCKLHAPSCSTTDKLLKKHLKIWLKTDIFLLDSHPVFLIFPTFLLCQVLPWSLCEPQKDCFLQGSPTAAGNILVWIAQH